MRFRSWCGCCGGGTHTLPGCICSAIPDTLFVTMADGQAGAGAIPGTGPLGDPTYGVIPGSTLEYSSTDTYHPGSIDWFGTNTWTTTDSSSGTTYTSTWRAVLLCIGSIGYKITTDLIASDDPGFAGPQFSLSGYVYSIPGTGGNTCTPFFQQTAKFNNVAGQPAVIIPLHG